MNRAFRIIKLLFLGVALLLCLAIPVIGLASTAINWQGICYGFTDSQSPCPWWEFARNEMFWTSMVFIPFLFLAALAWILMAAAQFVVGFLEKRKNENPDR
jgi:hypothetical protein